MLARRLLVLSLLH